MLKCIFIFVLSGTPKTMWKWWSHSMSLNNIQMVSVTGRYLIIQQHSHQNVELTILHYTVLVWILGRYSLITSFQQSHQNATYSIHKLLCFSLTVFRTMQLFSCIQKCQYQHSSCMPRKDSWHTYADPHTTIFSVTSIPSATTTTTHNVLWSYASSSITYASWKHS
jgi:hypothetical protein